MLREKSRAVLATIAGAAIGTAATPCRVMAGDEHDEVAIELFMDGFVAPVYMCSPPGDIHRLFVMERGGAVLAIEHRVRKEMPFLDLSGQVGVSGEQGMLGLAFPPDYVQSGVFYVCYSRITDGATVLSRFRRSAQDPNIAGTAEEVLLVIPQTFDNHKGGCLQFGPYDGYLYMSTGDGGGEYDPEENAQDISDNLRGKMLRLDVSIVTGYAIPPDNPFVGGSGDDEIFMYGLRNPWRFSFDRWMGSLYIGDVGQASREEVNRFLAPSQAAGANMGWPCMEGTVCHGLVGCTCATPNFTPPIYEYDHEGSVASITGGYVYRSNSIPRWRGRYVFADFVLGRVWSFKLCNGQLTDLCEHTDDLKTGGAVTEFGFISSMAEDENAELYLLEYFTGRILKIVPQFSPGDWDRSGTVGSADITSFLSDWFSELGAGGTRADFDGNCAVGSADITAFLQTWFASL